MEVTNLLDFENYIKHILVVEASDSNEYNPLQTVVTVEINLHDLNDNQPFIVSLYSSECARYGLSNDYASLSTELTLDPSSYLNISLQHFSTNPSYRPDSRKNRGFSTKILIEGLSEYSTIGKCLGQFLITDLDTPRENRKLEAIIRETKSTLLQSSMLIFNNIKSRDNLLNQNSISYDLDLNNQTNKGSSLSNSVQTNEIFELFLNFEPDAEMQKVYDFTIELRDHGQQVSFLSQTQLIILIKDENDNPPKFDQRFYNFTVDEWNQLEDNSLKSLEYCFGKVEAHDLDTTEENSQIFYEITQVELGNFKLNKREPVSAEKMPNFYINQSTGYICVKNRTSLDRETKSKFEFQIKAKNKNSSVSSSVMAQVNIKDLNDNQPEFLQKEYTFMIAEKDSNLVRSLLILDSSKNANFFEGKHSNFVGIVRAFDKDESQELVYYLSPKNSNSYFELNTKNSENPYLKFKNNLILNLTQTESEETLTQIEEADVYDALIEDVDNSAYESISYQVTTIKHSPPATQHFSNKSTDEFVFSINNDLTSIPKQETIADKKNKKIFWPVENLEEWIFVNSSTGAVYLLQKLDREQIKNIKFFVYVKDRKDNSKPSLNNSVQITIEIIDINDSKPVCSSLSLENESGVKKSEFLNRPLDSLALKFNLTRINLKNFRLAKIYKFNCLDLDENKNSELKYEIESFYVREFKKQKQITNLSTQKMTLLEKSSNEFLKSIEIFWLDPKTGQLNVNLSADLWEDQNKVKDLVELVENKFLIIKVKISDKGIISLYNVYYLRIFICFNADSKEFCYFNEGTKKNRPILAKKIINLEDYEEEWDFLEWRNEFTTEKVLKGENRFVQEGEKEDDDLEYEDEEESVESYDEPQTDRVPDFTTQYVRNTKLNAVTKSNRNTNKIYRNDNQFDPASSASKIKYFSNKCLVLLIALVFRLR